MIIIEFLHQSYMVDIKVSANLISPGLMSIL